MTMHLSKVVRRALLPLLLALVALAGPGAVVFEHTCRIRGTELSFGSHSQCCGQASHSQGLAFTSSGCCTESSTPLGLGADFSSVAPLQLKHVAAAPPFWALTLTSFLPHLLALSADCALLRPPPLLVGRTLLIAQHQFLI